MSKSRVRLAARIAAVEAFREERQRQHLAVARQAATAASEAVAAAEHVLVALDRDRMAALVTHGDLARYLAWGDLAVQASDLHGQAVEQSLAADAMSETTLKAWTESKARAEATGERAQRIARVESSHIEARESADGMDLWLSRTGDNL